MVVLSKFMRSRAVEFHGGSREDYIARMGEPFTLRRHGSDLRRLRGVLADGERRTLIQMALGTDILEGDELRADSHGLWLVDEVAPDMEQGHLVGLKVFVRESQSGAAIALSKLSGIGSSPLQCREPRKVRTGADGTDYFHIGPRWVERAPDSAKDYYCAPYPYFIAGLRSAMVEQAKSEGKMLLIRGCKAGRGSEGSLIVRYLFVRLVDPDAEDFAGNLPRAS